MSDDPAALNLRTRLTLLDLLTETELTVRWLEQLDQAHQAQGEDALATDGPGQTIRHREAEIEARVSAFEDALAKTLAAARARYGA